MAIDGDITVWVSNGYAFARFEAESKAGPIIMQASAPLAAVRQRLVNEAGELMEGEEDHVVGEAEVHRAAKDAAVGNLRRLAPYIFFPPGPHSAVLALARRRRRKRPAAPPPRRPEPVDDDDDVHGTEIGAASGDQAKSLALTVAKQDPRVRAGMFLLGRARKDPRARRRIRAIHAHAAAGNPRAQRDRAALLQAQKVRQVLAADQRKQDGAAKRLAAMKIPGPPPLLAARAAPSRYRGIFAAWERGTE